MADHRLGHTLQGPKKKAIVSPIKFCLSGVTKNYEQIITSFVLQRRQIREFRSNIYSFLFDSKKTGVALIEIVINRVMYFTCTFTPNKDTLHVLFALVTVLGFLHFFG